MRTVAIIAVYNEERFIRRCLEHLTGQGVEVYLIDNGSTDETLSIASSYLKKGLIGIESFPRSGVYSWQPILERKEQIADSLEADWFMHADPDEIRLAPRSGITLSQSFAEVEERGYNAVNFMEFTFLPTRESPDHDHPDYQQTMRWYYPFLPFSPHRLTAWKKQPCPVELAWSGGHEVRFPGLRMYPEPFPMRHYIFLNMAHAIEKYVGKTYDAAEVEKGWHGQRSGLRAEGIKLPSQSELRLYMSDDRLDASDPRMQHYFTDPPALTTSTACNPSTASSGSKKWMAPFRDLLRGFPH